MIIKFYRTKLNDESMKIDGEISACSIVVECDSYKTKAFISNEFDDECESETVIVEAVKGGEIISTIMIKEYISKDLSCRLVDDFACIAYAQDENGNTIERIGK